MQPKGPFFCMFCQKMLEWRDVKAGKCQGHILTEFAAHEAAATSSTACELAEKHKMDRKYGNWTRAL